MDEKDVKDIATAVSGALAKLNADTKAAEARTTRDAGDQDDKSGSGDNTSVPNEVFKCPDCGGEVAGAIQFCQHCGCALEWEE